MPKIHWGLNWLNQWDPRLIKFIREELLISPPSPKQKLNLQNEFDPMKPWKHQGQNGETLAIESLYGLNKVENNKRRYFICYRKEDGIEIIESYKTLYYSD